MNTGVGIDAISFYSPNYYLDLKSLAAARGTDPDGYYAGLGQEKMAVPPPDEDIVTMGANAASQILRDHASGDVSALLLATESGIDQSKAAGIYIHNLLGLSDRCRIVELKQACYGATAALQMAIPSILQRPKQKILIVAADIARYGLGTTGEPTQGSGAVAMLISASPRLIDFDAGAGFHTEDVMDFWRPNYRSEALVNGKASIRIYIKSLLKSWEHYQEESGRQFDDFDRFCYHLPFSNMAEMAHRKLAAAASTGASPEHLRGQIADSLTYNRLIGNSYAASLYIGLTSLLDFSGSDLASKRLGFFSYGSGCMAEFFSGTVLPGYERGLCRDFHQALLGNRIELTVDEYEAYYRFSLPTDGRDLELPRHETGRYRLAAMRDHQRIYRTVAGDDQELVRKPGSER